MKTYQEKVSILAETVKDKANSPRWKHQTSPTVEGEIIAVLREHDLPPTQSAIKGLAEIFKQVNRSPDMFYINDERFVPSANLGKILRARVENLTKPDEEADKILKSWFKSDTETVVVKHIPRLINFNLQQNNPVHIPLNDLISLTFRWDKNSADLITTIATNYYLKEGK